jgi:hypothetical protein
MKIKYASAHLAIASGLIAAAAPLLATPNGMEQPRPALYRTTQPRIP